MKLKIEQIAKYKAMANAIRFLSADAVENAQSGHPGMPMGIAEVVTILFSRHMRFNPKDPDWPNRDRFILSAGHGSMLIYSLLYFLGYSGITKNDIINFRRLGYPTAGHPEYGEIPGIETTTGPLGQGLANGLGMAISEKKIREQLGSQIINHNTYVLAGDGCIMEGISHEMASLAGHLKLSNLIVLYDDNKISIDGPTSLTMSDLTLDRFSSQGWHVKKVNGYDFEDIDTAITEAKLEMRPSLIACETVIGYGSPSKQGRASSHGAPLGKDEIKKAKEKFGWQYKSFEIPENIESDWKSVSKRNNDLYISWKKSNSKAISEITEIHRQNLEGLTQVRQNLVNSFLKENKSHASRKSSEIIIKELIKSNLNLLGGSADLTGSNNTLSDNMQSIKPENFSGNYIHWGVREHCMAAAMNGIALHGFFIPYGGTFLVFSDYCKPSIRLSALMKQKVIYIFTHDSIGLGEDGPTHQPVEHLSALRVIPNLKVFRPCDSVETTECWELALLNKDGPSLIALSRQGLELLRSNKFDIKINYSSKGAYVIIDFNNPDISLIATGSEVSLAVKASEELFKKNVKARVISMPSMEFFQKQNKEYKQNIIQKTKNVFIEAGSSQSWNKWMKEDDIFIGLDTFGASGQGKVLFEKFKITTEEIVKKALEINHK